jgi:hypothetical protein
VPAACPSRVPPLDPANCVPGAVLIPPTPPQLTCTLRRSLASSVIGRDWLSSESTTSLLRKRKASEADGQLTPSEGRPQKRQTPDSLAAADLPATPVTNASDKMDSDDEFNSSMSGNDFDEDSDMDLEEGMVLTLDCENRC